MDQAPREHLQGELANEGPGLFTGAGSQAMGDAMLAADGKGQAADAGFTPVMVRLTPADLETVDALIGAGIASSRAEAIRWAVARMRARPTYEQLRRRAREIQRLKAEF